MVYRGCLVVTNKQRVHQRVVWRQVSCAWDVRQRRRNGTRWNKSRVGESSRHGAWFVCPAPNKKTIDAGIKEATKDVSRLDDELWNTERRLCMEAVQKTVSEAMLNGRHQAQCWVPAPEHGAQIMMKSLEKKMSK